MEHKKRVVAKKRSSRNPLIVKISLVIIVFFVLFATIFKITELIITNKKDVIFPKLEISLNDVPIEQINSETKDIKYYDNTINIITEDETTTFKNVELKGHGNSTWASLKKPYQIKLAQKSDLFGYNAAKKWLLLTNYLDETYLRNDTAFFLQHLLNSKNPINGQFLELYIDDNYYGLYYLTEKVEIGENRINLKDSSGIIVELDNLHTTEENCPIYSKNGDCFNLKDAVNKDIYTTPIVSTGPNSYISSTPMVTFIDKINQLITSINKKDFSSIENIIDIDSFAKYFLINEFTDNPDAYGSSFFFYFDGENDKIHAGSGWDFDASLGNPYLAIEGIDHDELISPLHDMILKEYIPEKTSRKNTSPQHLERISTLLYDLMEIPEFENRVKEIYQETLSGRNEELLDHIRSQAEYIREAALRDQDRWKIKANFDDEVDYLIDWVAKRYDHFEQTYGKDSKSINQDPAPKSQRPSTK